MKAVLRSEVVEIDGDESTVWYLDSPHGVSTNLNQALREDVLECQWIDQDETLLQVRYSNWDSRELIAIVNHNGQLLRNAIVEIYRFLPEHALFIAEMYFADMGAESAYYSVSEFETKLGVIDRYGKFLVSPIYERIVFDDDDGIFFAHGKSDKPDKFNKDGHAIG